jgi:bisanhydrobacterioruberin hydratase
MKNLEKRLFIIFIIIYLVGIIGFMVPQLRNIVVPLTPFTILSSLIVALAFENKLKFKSLLTLFIIGISGFFVEYIGVKTGVIFGTYTYGKTLGLGWNGIPYMIGVNWLAIIYYTNNLSTYFTKNRMIAACTAATFAILYDYFLEPVAMAYDFWQWSANEIPIQNYVAWFLLSLCFSLFYQYQNKPIKNKMATYIFLIQITFFTLLHLYLKFL